MAEKFFGVGVKRKEDPRLVTGKASYVNDIKLPGMLHIAFKRSDYAHARITSIDTGACSAAPGVVKVYTGKSTDGVCGLPCGWAVTKDIIMPKHPAIAVDKVRYTGDIVAAVVAETAAQARDAADLIVVDYEPLPAVIDKEKAIQPGSPLVHDDVPNNISFHFVLGGGDVDKAFAEADHVVKQRLINQRLIPTPIEPRGCVAQYNPYSEELTLWIASQNPHLHRWLIAAVQGFSEAKVRVIAPQVGGGFGSKIHYYPEEAICSYAARDLGGTVKWFEQRTENYVATIHGRDHIEDVELALKNDGSITGIRVKTLADMGAYLSTFAPGIPTILFSFLLGGVYKIQNMRNDVYGVMTNTTPTDAYRGAGRPEATYVVERMMDLAADELKMDPAEIRRKNFVQPNQFPYQCVSGLTYDSGDYEKALNKALELSGYQDFRRQQAEARKAGKLLGIGLSSYIEVCGLAPSHIVGATGGGIGGWESAKVRVLPTGKVTVYSGSSSHGQGHETSMAQIVADQLGVDMNDVEIVQGDTAQVQNGIGTFGSRSMAVGGTAVAMSVSKVKAKAMKYAAHLLEAAEEDLTYENGKIHVKGSPDRAKTFVEIAAAAWTAHSMPAGLEPGLDETTFYDPTNFTWPFGTHVAFVEIDRDTGHVELKRYLAVDDCGQVINPLLADGQVHGGVAQGIAQALFEGAVYNSDGQLLSGSLMDYALPRADYLPSFETAHTVTSSPVNPLGVKGIGEAGTIASTVAVANAVMDALGPLNIKHLDMPYTDERVWNAIHGATAGNGHA